MRHGFDFRQLVQQLRQVPAAGTWERFVRLYTPLLLHWARRLGLQDHNAADLVQDVLIVLVRKLPEFEKLTARPEFPRLDANDPHEQMARSAPPRCPCCPGQCGPATGPP